MTLSFPFRSLLSFRNVFVVSILLRAVLILYSEWHDAHSVVKYTDVDYRVFSDAARFILRSDRESGNVAKGLVKGFFEIGDPYTRATYRYTPLLAVILTPNEWLHPSFGKYLFATCDVLAGLLICKLLVSVILPATQDRPSAKGQSKSDEYEDRATVLAAVHLLNPMVFSISTRGSSESILLLFVLTTLYCALKGRWDSAAVMLGVSTHWKIYPVIYGLACVGVIGGEREKMIGKREGWVWRIVNGRTIRFGVISAGTFFVLGAGMYLIWGYPFLYETYLYHLYRRDHRHNFSPYFYLTYLTYPSPDSPPFSVVTPIWRKVLRSPLTSFVPQMGLSLGAGLLLGKRREDLPFAWFVQTVVFVVLNKVCTSQYFLWYLLFLPLLVPRLSIRPWQAGLYVLVWVAVQAVWLMQAYKLEFLGQNTFMSLWWASLLYVVGNCGVLLGIMEGYE